jgi:Uma2 family endonuclease
MMEVEVAKRRFNVEEYHRMGESGILTENDRVELIHGEIITMSPIGTRHAACVNRLNMLFTALFRGEAIVSVQNPVRINHDSEPEPDLVLLKHEDDFYAQRPPAVEDVLLIVEVSDSTLKYDQKVKLPLYVQAGVSQVWIVNLEKEEIEVHWLAGEKDYQQKIYQKKDMLHLMNREILAEDILGK